MKLFYAILLGGLFLTFVSVADTKPTPRRLPFPSKTLPIRWVEDKASLDCIRLGIKPSADSVKVGEELTLTITAEYTTGLENLAGYMGDCQDFTLQLVLPQGFEQTGGDYHDLLRINLSPTHKTATLTLTGKFTTHNPDACFLALRGSAKADANSLFIKKAQWCTKTYCSLTPEQITAMPLLYLGANFDTLKKAYLIRVSNPQTFYQYSLDGDNYQNSPEFALPAVLPKFVFVKESNAIDNKCLIQKSTAVVFTPSAARSTATAGLSISVTRISSRPENPGNAWGCTYEYKITDPTPPDGYAPDVGQTRKYLYLNTPTKGPYTTPSYIDWTQWTVLYSKSCYEYAAYIQRINGDGSIGAEKSNEYQILNDPVPSIINKPTTALTTSSISLGSTGCPVGFVPKWFKNKTYVSTGTNLTDVVTTGQFFYEVACYSNSTNNTYDTQVCTDQATVIIYPCNTLTLQTNRNREAYCVGETMQLSATGSEEGKSNVVGKYIWSGANLFSSTAQNPTVTASLAGLQTYSVIYSIASVNGLATSCSVSSSFAVNVFPLIPTPTITASKTSACYGETVSLTASGMQAGSTLLWSTGATTPTISTQVLTTTPFSVRALDPINGCNSPVSPVTYVSVPGPPGTLEMSENGTYFGSGTVGSCYGATLTLRVQGCYTGSTYVWWDGLETTTGTRTTLVNYVGNKVYTVSCKSANNCLSEPSKGTVIVQAPSKLTVTSSSNPVTLGNSVTLTASGCLGGQVKWQCCGDAFGTFAYTGTSLSVSPTATTTYQAYCQTGYCLTAKSDPLTVEVVPPCTVAVSITPTDATNACQPALLTALATNSTVTAYQWYNNNVAIAGATQATYTASTNGSYTVKASTSAICSATSAATPVSIVPLTLSLSASPNPQQGSPLNLSATATGGNTYTWSGPSSFSSTLQNPSLAEANVSMSGVYTAAVQRTNCSLTVTATLSVSIVATCTLDFNGDPVLDCTDPEGTTPSLGKITVLTKGKLLGRSTQYLLERQMIDPNTGTASFVPDSTYTTWRSDSVFVGLKKAVYRVSIQETQAGSASVCKGISGSRTLNINCGGTRKQREHNPNCGVPPVVDLSNVKPLSRLMVGDTIWAGGDFEVIVTKITASQPTSGTFSGFGFMKVPYMLDTQILVELKGTIVNEDYEQVGGIIETAYDPSWSSMASIKNTAKDVAKLAQSLAEAISDLLAADLTKISKKQLDEMVKVIMEQAAKELPPALQDQLRQATDALVAAKAAYDANPNATTQAGIDAAKTQVTQANQSRDAFLTQYANIVKLALQQIYQEKGSTPDATSLGQTTATTSISTVDEYFSVNDAAWLSATQKQEILAYYNAEVTQNKNLMSKYFSLLFKDNNQGIKTLAQEVKVGPQRLQDYIYEKKQSGVADTQLVSDAKNALYAQILKILYEKIYK